MSTVVCPQCGRIGEVVDDEIDAEGFCPVCDFPLFWATARAERSDDALANASRPRLPGVQGRAIAGCRCPACSEPNPVLAERCIRCGSDFGP